MGATTKAKLGTTIRFRAQRELKIKLVRTAEAQRKNFAAFMREELWRLVEEDSRKPRSR